MIFLKVPRQRFERAMCHLRLIFEAVPCRDRDPRDPNTFVRRLADLIEIAERDLETRCVDAEPDEIILLPLESLSLFYGNLQLLLDISNQTPLSHDAEADAYLRFVDHISGQRVELPEEV